MNTPPVNPVLDRLKGDPYRSSFLAVWGLSYFVAAALDPGLVGNLSPLVSLISMAVMAWLIITNLIFDWKLLWLLLGARATVGMVASWTGMTQWAVSYSPGVAAVSMALANGIAATVMFSKVLD